MSGPITDSDPLDPGWRERAAPAPYDPLRLCVLTTVALLGWLLGPLAVLAFASVAVVGYARARRDGLLRSRCKLGDTRLVLLWLTAVAVVAAVFLVREVAGLLG